MTDIIKTILSKGENAKHFVDVLVCDIADAVRPLVETINRTRDDLIEANNRYQQEARDARSETRVLRGVVDTLAVQMDEADVILRELRAEKDTAHKDGMLEAILIIKERMGLYTHETAINALKECMSSIRAQADEY